ncbi:MAG: tRNA-dihydrouridine synthase family protein [Clostridiales bacterium]|nr:tRNA-dihydrouridine synthase family protein [Clostridiales bacterium]
MKYYFAPMEGVTGYIYRNAHHKFFPGIDKYYTPFVATNQNLKFKTREINDLLPEHNQGIPLVPQVISNNATHFVEMVKQIQEFGYEEVNLNLGCPSGTVVSKFKGSGFLAKPDDLDVFLDEIYSKLDVKLSIKTRIGKDSPEEFKRILAIYNKYPVYELTIHPRIRADFYKNKPNLEVFEEAVKESKNPICYNGDLFTVEDCNQFHERFPEVPAVMLGRGLIRNPNLVLDTLHGETQGIIMNCAAYQTLDKKVLKQFHDQIYHDYQEVMSGDINTIHKMKELWHYMSSLFTNYEQYEKKIKRTNKLSDYDRIIAELFRNEEIAHEAKPGF